MRVKKTLQKYVIVDNETVVTHYIKEGWKIISVTGQPVSIASGYSTAKGNFAIVLEKYTNEK